MQPDEARLAILEPLLDLAHPRRRVAVLAIVLAYAMVLAVAFIQQCWL